MHWAHGLLLCGPIIVAGGLLHQPTLMYCVGQQSHALGPQPFTVWANRSCRPCTQPTWMWPEPMLVYCLGQPHYIVLVNLATDKAHSYLLCGPMFPAIKYDQFYLTIYYYWPYGNYACKVVSENVCRLELLIICMDIDLGPPSMPGVFESVLRSSIIIVTIVLAEPWSKLPAN
jgi:hypothetical protein